MRIHKSELFANDSIENIHFEDYDTIILLPCIACVETENWLNANNIPFERIRKSKLPKIAKKTCIFANREWNAYFGLKTNINANDLAKMAMTLVNSSIYDKKYQ